MAGPKELKMADLIYRGVAHTGEKQQRTETLADQMRRPTLVYRGVAHDGVRPTDPAPKKKQDLIYRGARFA